MKKFIIAFVSLVVLIVGVVCVFSNKEKVSESHYLRIHVRANSNKAEDQRVKYSVKEAVVDYLTPLIAEGASFEQAYNVINIHLGDIENIADKVLLEHGFNYKSTARLNEEYFPTRSYAEYTLENGYYDALILELGTGEGNNWWCVVYPPLCFIGNEGTDVENLTYKSKILEIIKNFFA